MFYVTLINSLVVSVAVVVHYESLYLVTLFIPKMQIKHRYRIVFGVFAALSAHALEIWIFALAYFLMNRAAGWGNLSGNIDGGLMDCGYFSFTVFTTLGFGDIEPLGHLRYLTGIESLTGLVLISWSASFLFYEMQRHWNTR
ncbi:MAG: two pore domain potassium channel family protein [Hyphomicrobiales bacterium]|nr:two pore domain potassium channel family protein [Hyphomicrobiales bacterium]MCP5371650.1 two pore domain potassium channel family protein [Hyphomicrobiales bacterium]